MGCGTLPPGYTLAPATRADAAVLLELVRELAEYERLPHEVTATPQDLEQTLFGERAYAEALVARRGDEPVGFALFFHNYSTFLGKPGLYLEDVFVRPEHRGQGLGQAMLVRLAGLAVERGCGRLELAALDWNEPAIGFYRSLGARAMDEWTVYRFDGEALRRLARDG